MKEETFITNFKKAERERLQNNQMILGLNKSLDQTQQMLTGLFNVLRKIPGYDAAVAELAEENKKAQEAAKAEEAAEEAKAAADMKKAEAKLDLGPKPKKSKQKVKND